MAGELTVKEKSVVSAVVAKGLDEVLKPLIREIFLFDTYVAGTSYLKDRSVLKKIKEGEELRLQREDNKFDSNAVLVLTAVGEKLGYVPERDNIVFARLMDAGKLLKARIRRIKECGNFTEISIGLYLVDI